MKNIDNQLLSINLEDAGISDQMCHSLFKSLNSKDPVLEKLNLAKNNISLKGVGLAEEMLTNNRNLKCLNMHWN
jgi:hypothetical protein